MISRLRARYCTATDTYYRSLADVVQPGEHDINGWKNGVHSVQTMFRKEEQDWRMVRPVLPVLV